ncbi:sugar ABC transporter ATP-binding protein [Moorella sp. Hama-1]|uniref:sugar ABC transporter ATP-binding protein n=1 Tax=Moorella sp. Hama-1 TaxID=2138101 RepID=UPI000D64A96A|nr:sugar ABC transporter ATP-binding protein [Moorella sp. Hama-1]BCV21391.1 ribose import ATP-binding protein RbsA [Moorella sp. Hama-1]
MPILECNNIKKSFGAVKALEDATICIKPGEIRALLGGNGSGKSTLAKILAGIVKKDHGEIKLDSKTIEISSPSYSKKLGIVVTSQELSLASNLSIEKNLMLSMLPTRYKIFEDHKEIKAKAYDILNKVSLLDIKEKRIGDLPANQQYLIEFAKALIQQPKILIVDEVTSALFSQDFALVKDILLELSQVGASIIFISHRISEIYSVCETVTVMKNGVTVGTYNLKEIKKDELLLKMSDKEFNYNPQVEASGIDKFNKAKTVLALKNFHLPSFGSAIDFEARAGEFIGVSGLQGQGQREFIRSIFGLNGHVQLEIEGKEVSIKSPSEAVKLSIGFLSGDRENEGTFSERSIRENLDAVCNIVLNGGPANYAEIIKNQSIKLHSINQPIKSLSGGNQQKVVFGRWISSKPKILLADDPNKGVDVHARHEVHHILKKLVESGSVVIMNSSDDEELVDISKIIPNCRIIIMYEGSIVKTLTGSDITVQNIISSSLMKGA